MTKIVLNIASRLLWSAYATNKVIEQALEDGYDGVSMLPFWGSNLIKTELYKYVAYVGEPWNYGSPIDWARLMLRGEKQGVTALDMAIFPWFAQGHGPQAWWNPLRGWQPQWQRYVSAGAIPVTHDPKREGILEVSPLLRMTGQEVIQMAVATKRLIAYDTNHAIRKLHANEGPKSGHNLGYWRDWLVPAVELGLVQLFDFHVPPMSCLKGDFDFELDMLYVARKAGFRGDIRVEVSLPPLHQLDGTRQLTQAVLHQIKD